MALKKSTPTHNTTVGRFASRTHAAVAHATPTVSLTFSALRASLCAILLALLVVTVTPFFSAVELSTTPVAYAADATDGFGYSDEFMKDSGTGEKIGWDEEVLNVEGAVEDKPAEQAIQDIAGNLQQLASWLLAFIVLFFAIKLTGRAIYGMLGYDEKASLVPKMFGGTKAPIWKGGTGGNDAYRTTGAFGESEAKKLTKSDGKGSLKPISRMLMEFGVLMFIGLGAFLLLGIVNGFVVGFFMSDPAQSVSSFTG